VILCVLSSLSNVPSLLQETAGPGTPVEVVVRVNTGGSVVGTVSNWKVISPWPVGGKDSSSGVTTIEAGRAVAQLLFDWSKLKIRNSIHRQYSLRLEKS